MESTKNSLFGALSLLTLVIVVAVIYGVFFGPLSSYINSLPSVRTITVSDSDKVTAKPDIATVSFSVVTENVNAVNAINDNNSKMNQAIDALKNQGISENDIKTSQYNLEPVYTYPTRDYSGTFIPTIAKYRLTQTVSVKIRDFSKISSVMDQLPKLGVNQIGNISFSIDDSDVYLAQAREGAIKKAEAKAQSIASQSGISLGRIISVSDYQSNNYPYYKTADTLGMGAAPVAASAPSIQPGSQDVSVNVSIVYEIK